MRPSAFLNILSTFSFLSLGGCHSSPAVSSSSNWLVCSSSVACMGIPGAVDCVEGYCVDAKGNRIAADGSGGDSSLGGSTGGTVAGGGNDPASGGSDGGSDASGGSGAGSSSGGDGSGAGSSSGGGGGALNACDGLLDYAGCDSDDDCTTGRHLIDCCGSVAEVGVAVDQRAAFEERAIECGDEFPLCECASSPFAVLQDGRVLTEGQAGVSCDAGACRTHVQERPCGDGLTCELGQICLAVETVLGPQSETDFSCVESPCGAAPLDCGCASVLCELPDTYRMCTTGSWTVADVFCQDGRQ